MSHRGCDKYGSVSRDSIDRYLWSVQLKCMNTIGTDAGCRAFSPLNWYIYSGRASVDFLHKLFAVKPDRIARICMGGGSHDEIIKRIKQAVKYRDSL